MTVTLADPHFATVRGWGATGDIAFADWDDDVEGGPHRLLYYAGNTDAER